MYLSKTVQTGTGAHPTFPKPSRPAPGPTLPFQNRQDRPRGPPYISKTVQTGTGAHPTLYVTGTGDFTQGVKWSGRESDQPHPSCAKVTNEWSCTSSLMS